MEKYPRHVIKRIRTGKISRQSVPDKQEKRAQRTGRLFPIIGIGASAGGLEALQLFLKNVPSGSNMAFVIVQHLDPTRKGIMPELLQRATEMTVFQVKDRMKVKPYCVYVIPPNKDISILHGVLYLLEPAAPRGLRLPIDFFFRSLAQDRQERSIGVILSGMGTDGTLGVRAIKEKSGVVLVQDPATAKFDSMPRSAIDAALADFIAPAEELPQNIVSYLKHIPLIAKPVSVTTDKSGSALEKAVILLRMGTGHDFSLYKKNTVYRRIERRMRIHQIDKINTYIRFLQENPPEQEILFKELLIGVTNFFRDPAEWALLKEQFLPSFLSSHPHNRTIRAWVPGCSTGEEAYSLAIIFKEVIDQVKPKENVSIQIFATDLDRDAIDKARKGVFPANITADVSPERLNRFFTKEGNSYRIGKKIRDMIIFAPHNVIMNPPFTKLDIITCRNLLIYLTPELQKKLLPLFHYSLNPGGFLFLGSAESTGGFTNLFVHLNQKSKIYKRSGSNVSAESVAFPSSYVPALPIEPEYAETRKPVTSFQSLADQLLLQRYSPPAVLVNDKGDILYISGRTGKYLEPAAGKANMNIFAMARGELRSELTTALRMASRQKNKVVTRNAEVRTNGRTQHVNLTVQIIEEPETLRGMAIIVFTDVASPRDEKRKTVRNKLVSVSNARLAKLVQELRQVREELLITREEMYTSQEELTSTNEELQSTNEELQSTNEELSTSKEEMQSMNEELQTVNCELQVKLDEFSKTSNDMKNLLESTDIAILFLDKKLNVRRYTAQTTKIIKLIPGDVGRPLTDLTTALLYPELIEDLQEVMRTLVFTEKQITSHDGQGFVVRVMPYRTLENVVDGVVITFRDILKHAQPAGVIKKEMRPEKR